MGKNTNNFNEIVKVAIAVSPGQLQGIVEYLEARSLIKGNHYTLEDIIFSKIFLEFNKLNDNNEL